MGVATGCGCKEVYRFPHTTYPYSSCICSFLGASPTFCSFFKCFSFFRRRRQKKNAKSRFFFFAWCVRKLALYRDVIHLFNWKSAVEHDGGV